MRILVVDDNADIRDLVRMGLEAESFVVDVAPDGERGSYIARTNDYDLIILDSIMPRKLGVDVCKEIRSAGREMPILMLSVQSEIYDKVDLLNAGADDYMTKPFSFDELLARVRVLLRRPKQVVGEILSLGSIKLNSKTHEVSRGERSIYLTKKEFTLFEFLLRNQDKIISRGMIMEHVWDLDANPFSNTIETHIFNIRKKIENIKDERLIWNVPGRGYRVTAAV